MNSLGLNKLFCEFYLLKPWSSDLSPNEQKEAWWKTIAIGIPTFGLVHLGTAFWLGIKTLAGRISCLQDKNPLGDFDPHRTGQLDTPSPGFTSIMDMSLDELYIAYFRNNSPLPPLKNDNERIKIFTHLSSVYYVPKEETEKRFYQLFPKGLKNGRTIKALFDCFLDKPNISSLNKSIELLSFLNIRSNKALFQVISMKIIEASLKVDRAPLLYYAKQILTIRELPSDFIKSVFEKCVTESNTAYFYEIYFEIFPHHNLKNLEGFQLNTPHRLWEIPQLKTDEEKFQRIDLFLKDKKIGDDLERTNVVMKLLPQFRIQKSETLMRIFRSCLSFDYNYLYKYISTLPLSTLSLKQKKELILAFGKKDLRDLFDGFFNFRLNWKDPEELAVLDELISFIKKNAWLAYEFLHGLGLDPKNGQQNGILKKFVIAFAEAGVAIGKTLPQLGFVCDRPGSDRDFIFNELMPKLSMYGLHNIIESLPLFNLSVPADRKIFEYYLVKLVRERVSLLNREMAKVTNPFLTAENEEAQNQQQLTSDRVGFNSLIDLLDKVKKQYKLDPENNVEDAKLFLDMFEGVSPWMLPKLNDKLGFSKIHPQTLRDRKLAETLIVHENSIALPRYCLRYPLQYDEKAISESKDIKSLIPFFESAEISAWNTIIPLMDWMYQLEQKASKLRHCYSLEDYKDAKEKFLEILNQGPFSEDARIKILFKYFNAWIVSKLGLPHDLNEVENALRNKDFDKASAYFINQKIYILKRVLHQCALLAYRSITTQGALKKFELRTKQLFYFLPSLDKLYANYSITKIECIAALASSLNLTSHDLTVLPSYQGGQNAIYPFLSIFHSRNSEYSNFQIAILKKLFFVHPQMMERRFIRNFINLCVSLHSLLPERKNLCEKMAQLIFCDLNEPNLQTRFKLLQRRVLEVKVICSYLKTDKDFEKLEASILNFIRGSKDSYQNLVKELILRKLAVQTDNIDSFYERFMEIFLQWDDPESIFKLIDKIEQTHKKHLPLLSKWILAVANGTEALTQLRMRHPSNLVHWNEMSTNNFAFWAEEYVWPKNRCQEVLGIVPYDPTKAQRDLKDALNSKDIEIDLRGACGAFNIEEMHDIEEFLATLRKNKTKKAKTHTESIKLLKILAKLHTWDEIASNQLKIVLNQMKEILSDAQKETPPILTEKSFTFLSNWIENSLKSCKEQHAQMKMTVRITQNPEMMATMGDTVVGSCHAISSDKEYQIGLVSTFTHGKNKLVIATDEEDNVLGRAVIKLVYDDKKNPAVLLEPEYLGTACKLDLSTIQQVLLGAVYDFCGEHHLPLLVGKKYSYYHATKKFGLKVTQSLRDLESLPGLCSIEYDDILGGLQFSAILKYSKDNLQEITIN